MRKRSRADIDAKIARLAQREDPLAWWVRNRDGEVDARIDSDINRSCTAKDRYASREAARAVAAMNGMAGVLFTYECRYCQQWHLTRRDGGSS